MMNLDVFFILLTLHIAAGIVSLLVGLFVLLARKGDPNHIKFGNIYFYAMLINTFVALLMSIIHPKLFLFIIGIFTLYMLFTGKLYLKKRIRYESRYIDWSLLGLMFVFNCVFMFLGIQALARSNMFGVVLLVFGSIALFFIYQDLKNFRGEKGIVLHWKTMHLQRMVGSYISASTAFLVVNNTYLPPVVAWLLPTVFLVPLIIFWSLKNKIERR